MVWRMPVSSLWRDCVGAGRSPSPRERVLSQDLWGPSPLPSPRGRGGERQGWRTSRWAVVLLGLLLMSCASLAPAPPSPSPLPVLGALASADRAQVVQARTT